MNLFNKNNKQSIKNKLSLKSKLNQLSSNTDETQVLDIDWLSKIKVLPVAIFSGLMLILAVYFYINYASELEQNKQKIAYLSDLRQLSERVEKNALLVRNVDESSFNELAQSKSKIEKLLDVLQKGGIINSGDTEINGMTSQFENRLDSIKKEWLGNSVFINSLLNEKNNLVSLKSEVSKALIGSESMLNNAVSTQKTLISQSPSHALFAQELILLTNRIDSGLKNLFAGETFSLENGYSLVKDLRQVQYINESLINGNATFNLQPVVSPVAINEIKEFEKSFLPFNKITDSILAQITNLNNAKEIAKLVTSSSKNISQATEDLNKQFTQEGSTLNNFRTYAIICVILSIIGIILLGLIFYERSIQNMKLAKILRKNQTNEKAVTSLLEQMNPLDMGDFTNKIFVEDKFIAPIASKVDNTRRALSEIVKQMKSASERVLNSSSQTEETSKNLLEVSQIQFEKISDSIAKVGKITSEIDELSQVTWMAQEESKQSEEASIEGESLVNSSIEKMNEIRNAIQESSKKIKKLGESAQSITEVTGLIQDITKQINVLALNAAIQAASSGESGREFTIVAQEVQRLAFDSENATKKIAEIINEIQADANIAVSSMEKTTQEVVYGAQLTDKAGSSLQEIGKFARSVAERVQGVSEQLESKSSEMAEFALEMQSLQKITNKSSEVIELSAQQVENLKTIANKMDSHINKYNKLVS